MRREVVGFEMEEECRRGRDIAVFFFWFGADAEQMITAAQYRLHSWNLRLQAESEEEG